MSSEDSSSLPGAEPAVPSAAQAVPASPATGLELARATPGIADGRLRRLDPRYVPCARLAGLVAAAAIAFLGPLALLSFWLGADPDGLGFAGPVAGWVLIVCAAFSCAWTFPALKFRRLAWRLSKTGLEIRRGVCFRHRIYVPRARVQHTDVTRGPLERRFGLATLIVHTAGSGDNQVQLEGLEHGVALRVRDFLVEAGGRDG